MQTYQYQSVSFFLLENGVKKSKKGLSNKTLKNKVNNTDKR